MFHVLMDPLGKIEVLRVQEPAPTPWVMKEESRHFLIILLLTELHLE
jgi:hypothetical protein